VDTFLQAVNDLVNSGKLDLGSFKILFHGEMDASLLASARQCAPELFRNHSIELEPFIASWQQAQEVLWGGDLLLLLPGSPLEVPAKFYEYLQTGKPMFAVAQQGALTDLIDLTHSGLWAEPGDPAGIAASLLRALELPAVPPQEVERRWSGQFHFRSLTAQLAGWIRQLASPRSPVGGRA
jgi:hypothetical protein